MTDRAGHGVGPDFLVAGRYRLRSKLGGGGMGAVWLSHDRLLDRDVAIKQIITTAGMSPEQAQEIREQVIREGRAAAKLGSPHAIAVYDVVLEGGEPWLVMEYLPSRSLAKALSYSESLSPLEVAQIGVQAADALSEAHAAGNVHRDIKPGNVLIADRDVDTGLAKISDFGIAHFQGDRTGPSDEITGTPAYLPPEVARGADPAEASDVFSLAATLYTAVEGHPPYGIDDEHALVRKAAMAEIIPPVQAGPLTEILLIMMTPDPTRRPTMAQARDEIAAAAFGPGTASLLIGQPVRSPDGSIPVWAARNPVAAQRAARNPLPVKPAPAATPGGSGVAGLLGGTGAPGTAKVIIAVAFLALAVLLVLGIALS